jgi:hypothetical protein
MNDPLTVKSRNVGLRRAGRKRAGRSDGSVHRVALLTTRRQRIMQLA